MSKTLAAAALIRDLYEGVYDCGALLVGGVLFPHELVDKRLELLHYVIRGGVSHSFQEQAALSVIFHQLHET